MNLPEHIHSGNCGCYDPRPQPPACNHQYAPVKNSSDAGKWIGIGVGGAVFMVAFSLSAVAVAISAVSLTICVLVLSSLYKSFRDGKG